MIFNDIKNNKKIEKISKKENINEKEDLNISTRLQSNERLLTKTLIFRLLAIIITFTISYIYTNNFRKSLKVSIFIETLQLILYFINEHVWNNIKWGYVISM
tara:strand:+ start:1630 stop:1935 length:306 start_codon:yes stop_codon:yes gene_type:complete